MKMPAFQFYPGDWRKDLAVQSLGFFDRGVWWEMLCLMHESSERGVLLLAGLAMQPYDLARILGLDNQTLNQSLTTLITKAVARRRPDGAIFSKRMVEDEKLCEIRRKAGKMGGNPVLLKQKPTTWVNQSSTPSSSSSFSDKLASLAFGLSPAPAAAGEKSTTNSAIGKNTRKPRERNALLDALAMAEFGTLDGVPGKVWSRMQAGLREIKGATPDVSAEEIGRRAKIYRATWPAMSLTVEALVKHWPKMAVSKNGYAGAEIDFHAEPAGWREKVRTLKAPGNEERVEEMACGSWLGLAPDMRHKIHLGKSLA